MQLGFIALLKAVFANVGSTPVVVGLVQFFDPFLIPCRNTTDVAQQVRCMGTVWVLTEKASANFHAWKAEALYRKTGHFFIGEACANRDGLKPFGFSAQFFEPSAVQC